MQPSLLCCIDPGASGAYVLRRPSGEVVEVGEYSEPNDVVEVAHYLRGVNVTPGWAVAVIEQVWASPVMGVAAAFKFGENYGAWVMALKVAGVTVYGVTPQAWQKVAAAGVTGQGADRKRALKVLAAERFFALRPNLKNCDALLLSDYAVVQLKAGKALGEKL